MRAALAAGLLLAACGDDERLAVDAPLAPDTVLADAPPGDAAPVVDARDILGQFDDPSDFVRLDCAPGSLAGLDPSGIWNGQLRLPLYGDHAITHRYDPSGGGFTALLFGLPTDDVRLTGDDLFARVAWTDNGGWERVRAFDACAVDAEGNLFGHFAGCDEDVPDCYQGEFSLTRLQRIAGEGEGQGLALVSEWTGGANPWPYRPFNVRVAGGLAYLANTWDGLRIVDVSDPANPADVGASPVFYPERGEYYNDVKIVDGPAGARHALMASSVRGVVAIDVTDPAAPIEVAAFPPIPVGESRVNVHTLFTERIGAEVRAYLASGRGDSEASALEVWDVSDPAAPAYLGGYEHPDAAAGTIPWAVVHDLYVEGRRVYLSYWALGLVVVDATDPAAITLVGQFDDYPRPSNHSTWVTTTGGGRRIAVTGDEDYGAHLRLVDVDPASATFMSAIGELPWRPEVSVHNVMAFGDRAYVTWYQDGVRVIDLSDPTAPAVVGYYNTWAGGGGESFYEGAVGLDVDLASGLIYVADLPRGLLVLRILP